ncbi:MAG: hypothetical protein R6V31_11075 [Halohasta sp.]
MWSTDREALETAAKTHLISHFADRLTKSDFRITWDCPYCQVETTIYDKEQAIDGFKSHLYGHVDENVYENTHIGERLGWNGTLQINTPTDSPEADTLRRHFHSNVDLVILITANPEARIRLLHDELTDWPSRAVVVSTEGNPFDTKTELDFSGTSMELVELDTRLGPSDVGETVSRILDVHHTEGMRTSVEVDIMNEIIGSFDLKTSCDFVRMLASRLGEVEGVFQLYVNPDAHRNVSTVLNFLEEEFDMTIRASHQQFIRTS